MTETIIQRRTCRTCKQTKPLSEFYQRHGIKHECKVCVRNKNSKLQDWEGATQTCRRCGETKSYKQFKHQNKLLKRPPYQQGTCFACLDKTYGTVEFHARRKLYRDTTKVERNAKTRAWYKLRKYGPFLANERPQCSYCKTAKLRSEFSKNRCARSGISSWCKECAKQRTMAKKYNVAIGDIFRLMEYQNHSCAICQKPLDWNQSRSVHIDHCHVSGQTRGLLCSNCNNGLGCFRDSAISLTRAIEYLASPPIAMLPLQAVIAPP